MRTRRAKLGFALTLTLAGGGLTFMSGRVAVLEYLAGSENTALLQEAIELDPANPTPHYRLGTVYMLSTEWPDPSQAVNHLRRATELNPHNGRYWLQLAAASESLGDTSSAQAAMEHAVSLRPMSPEFWWAAGNFYLRYGCRETAWKHFRRLLELSPGYAEAVFHLCHRVAGDPSVVTQKILSPEASPGLKLAYVDFLCREDEYKSAFNIWQQTVAHATHRSFDFSAAQPYLERLLARNRLEEAASVWNELVRLEIMSQPSTSGVRDAVFNGDFERASLNAGFDWRTTPLHFVAIALETAGKFQGAQSLRVDFTVKHNQEYEILSQIVLVAPSCEYRLEAYVRSEGITSASGPRLRVLDFASPPHLDVSTAPVLGTTDWHPIALTFFTRPETRFVRLAVWRPRSRTYPTEISGSFWMDAVSLRALGPAGEQAALDAKLMP